VPRTSTPTNRLGFALQLGAYRHLGFCPDDDPLLLALTRRRRAAYLTWYRRVVAAGAESVRRVRPRGLETADADRVGRPRAALAIGDDATGVVRHRATCGHSLVPVPGVARRSGAGMAVDRVPSDGGPRVVVELLYAGRSDQVLAGPRCAEEVVRADAVHAVRRRRTRRFAIRHRREGSRSQSQRSMPRGVRRFFLHLS
jgi:hypothetical protein